MLKMVSWQPYCYHTFFFSGTFYLPDITRLKLQIKYQNSNIKKSIVRSKLVIIQSVLNFVQTNFIYCEVLLTDTSMYIASFPENIHIPPTEGFQFEHPILSGNTGFGPYCPLKFWLLRSFLHNN